MGKEKRRKLNRGEEIKAPVINPSRSTSKRGIWPTVKEARKDWKRGRKEKEKEKERKKEKRKKEKKKREKNKREKVFNTSFHFSFLFLLM